LINRFNVYDAYIVLLKASPEVFGSYGTKM
jgi:hypothetical protein